MAAIDVTVCVPTYQGAAYLAECLDSIAAQDLAGVEVLVVDEGSTDDTVAIAESYAGRIPDLRVLVNPERLGAVGNVNRCIDLARGRWIKPVFQDDLIDPGCLTTLRAARRRGVPLVVAARRYRFEDDAPTWQRDACDHLVAQSLVSRFGGGLLAGERVAEVAVETASTRVPHLNFVGEPVSILLDRRAARRAGGFDAGYAQLWDYELLVRLAVRKGVVLVAEPQATFRVHGGSETARNLSGSAYGINVLDRLRLHVAYALGQPYGPVRLVAAGQVPPVDLMAPAVGVARAARRLAEELPDHERDGARQQVEQLSAGLPDELPFETASVGEARNAEIALLLELSDRELPEHLRPVAEPAVVARADVAIEPTIAEVVTEPPSAGEPVPEVVPADPAAVEQAGTPTGRSSIRRTLGRVRRKAAGVARALRTNQWWGHMLGPIVAFACLQLGWRQVDPGEGLVRVVALVASAVALAGYGYVVNDAADVVSDELAGRSSAMGRLPVAARVGVVLGFAVAGALPWVWLRLEWPALLALGGIYLVPLVYSLQPIRLKERHLFGPIADASNAFVLPALFTIGLFAPLGDPTGPAALMLVGALLWAYGFGLRAIIKHQVDDAGLDRAVGTRTLVVQVGEARARRAVRQVLFPVELVGVVLLAATVLTWSWGTVLVGAGYAALFHGARLTGVIHRSLATTTLEKGWWMYWYQIWPALLLSAGLAVSDPWYLLLVGFVVVLFWYRVRSAFTIFFHNAVRELRARRRAPVS